MTNLIPQMAERLCSKVAWLAAILFVFHAHAQTVEISRVGQGFIQPLGIVHGIAISGNYAYCPTGSGLHVFNISDPTSPTYVTNTGFSASAAFPAKVFVSSGYAYLIGAGGFEILNLSNPARPIRAGAVSNLINRSTFGGLVVSNSFAYLAVTDQNARNRLHVVDVSNAANPVPLGETEVGTVHRIAISGNHAYLAGDRLTIFDVSNPTKPVETCSLYLTNRLYDLAISGNHAYAAALGSQASGFSGLLVIDIGNPTNPVHVATVGNTGGQFVVISDNHAYVGHYGGLSVVDISNPASPTLVGRFSARFQSVYGISISGHYAFLVGSRAMEVVDISNAANPVTIGFFPTGNGDARSVAQSGTYAYVADSYFGLQVIDISDATRVGGYYDFQNGSSPFDVALAGTHAYVLEGPNRLQVFDLNNPTNPVPVGVAQVPIEARRLAVADNYAYVIHDEPARIEDEQLREPRVGLTVFDISKPTNPVRRGSYSFTKGTSPAYGYGVNYLFAEDVVVSGDYAYVTYSGLDAMLLCAGHWRGTFPFGGIEVVDVSLPDNPVSRGGSFSWIAYFGMALVGNHLYAAYGTGSSCPPWAGGDSYTEGGLNVFSLSNPTNLVVVGGYKTNAYGSDIAVSGNYAYLVGSAPGFQVLDLSNPTNPVPVASYDPVGSKARVVAWRNYALVADGWAQGLQILSIRPVLFADRLGNQLRLKWGAGASDYILEGTTDLSAPQWQPVAGSPTVQDGFYQLNLPITESATFFRLRGQ